MKEPSKTVATRYRWTICSMLFLATAINYMDRQVLSLTWKDFIQPEFHWTDADYGDIAATFALVYAIANIFSGRFIDWVGTRKGYVCAIAVWSAGACMHALCGLATIWHLNLGGTEELFRATGTMALTISTVSAWFFIASRVVLAIGESGNFPAAVKVTVEYFPKKDRAYATAIFNSGSTIGALLAPLSIPLIARYFRQAGMGNGWEMAFLLIGALGFVWLGAWLLVYKKPHECSRVNEAELAYIRQDADQPAQPAAASEPPIPLSRILRVPQTWAIFLSKLVTDGVWWFFLFWTPAYLSDVYQLQSDDPTAIMLLFVLYAITMLSLLGGKLPTLIIARTGLNAYDARLKAMFCFTIFPLFTILAQPLGTYSYWWPVVLIGLAGAAHQSWSANLYSVASDLFPARAIGTITGINGMAGGIGSYVINKVSGHLFDYAGNTHMVLCGFEGKAAGYFIIFCYCAVAYLLGWLMLKALVPRYKRAFE